MRCRYRRCARELHPDKLPDDKDATERFQLLGACAAPAQAMGWELGAPPLDSMVPRALMEAGAGSRGARRAA